MVEVVKTKLLILSNLLQDKETLISSLNSDVDYIIFDNSQDDSLILDKVTSKIKNIGFVYYNVKSNLVTFLKDKYNYDESGNIIDVRDNEFEGYFTLRTLDLFRDIKRKTPDLTVDYLTCNMNNQDFKTQALNVEKKYGIKIRYSLDKTGSSSSSNWILESHNINIKNVYFNSNIDKWNQILDGDLDAVSGGLIFRGVIDSNGTITDTINNATLGTAVKSTSTPSGTSGYSIDYGSSTANGTGADNLLYHMYTDTNNNAYISASNIASTTMSFWIYLNSVPVTYSALLYNTLTGVRIDQNGSNAEFRFLSGGGPNAVVVTNINIPTGSWYFLTAMTDGSVQNFYMDGQLVHTRTLGSAPNLNTLRLSRNYYLNAYVYDLRVYNRDLTGTEVSTLYSSYLKMAVQDATLVVEKNTSGTLTLQSTNPNSVSLGFSIVTSPSNGTASITNNVLTYTPTTDYQGADSLTYKSYEVNGTDESDPATITIDVNTKPIASGSAISIDNNVSTTTIELTATDSTDTDLTYIIVSNPTYGTLGDISGNTVVYTINNGVTSANDSFTFKANDGKIDSDVATVTVQITAPVNLRISTLKYNNSIVFKKCLFDVDATAYPTATKALFDISGTSLLFQTDISGVTNEVILNDLSYSTYLVNMYYVNGNNNDEILFTKTFTLEVNIDDMTTATITEASFTVTSFNDTIANLLANIKVIEDYNYYDNIIIDLSGTNVNETYSITI